MPWCPDQPRCGAPTLRCANCDTGTSHRNRDRCPKCGSTDIVASTCRNPGNHGNDRCWRHGAASPVVLEAERRTKAIEAIGKLLTRRDADHDPEHPIEGLLAEIDKSRVVIAAYEQEIAVLAAATIDTQSGPKPHPVIELWNRERDFHVKACKLALDAGIDERRVRIAEFQATAFVDALNAALTRAGLTPDVEAQIRREVATELRALPAA